MKSNLNVIYLSQVDTMEMSGPTKISVPGYDDKVEFGIMFTFAYTVEGHGEYW